MPKLADTKNKRDTYKILGVDISSCSKEDFFRRVKERLNNGDSSLSPLFVVTVNPEIAIQAIIDSDFMEILKKSSINTADGVGISWAVDYLYHKNIDRITGSDSLEKICEICARYHQSVFLYGAAPGVAQRASEVLKKQIDNLEVEGVYSPEKPDIPLEELPAATQASLKAASVIFVALGAPSQEKWIHQNLDKLTNCKIIIGVGGSLDFLAGHTKRAPLFLRKSGLEWIYRLYRDPSRWRRMLRLPLFALNVILLKSSTRSLQKKANININKRGMA